MNDYLKNVSPTILAGGLGTRLKSVMVDRPKVLAPVAGLPFLAHLVKQLARADFKEATLLVGHGASQVFSEFGAGKFGMKLGYSVEQELLGTGGAVCLALPKLAGKTILLLNGDSYCNLDLRTFVAYHHGHGGKISMSLAWVDNASRFGRVALGQDDRITGFEEKASLREPGWINAGVYLIERELFELLSPTTAISLERDLLPKWISQFEVFGYRGGEFIDIGVPESYVLASAFFSAVNGES